VDELGCWEADKGGVKPIDFLFKPTRRQGVNKDFPLELMIYYRTVNEFFTLNGGRLNKNDNVKYY
jgi:hypothetical protein